MVNVLVIGASGLIGGAAVKSLRSAGHRVYGLARSETKARAIAQIEAIPIIGNGEDASSYSAAIEKHNIDAVVDAAGGEVSAKIILDEVKKISEARVSSGRPKLTYVYVSGIWVHGASTGQVNDLSVIGGSTPAPQLVAWRVEFEKYILAQRPSVDVIVIRPAIVYGGTSAIWFYIFKAIADAVKSAASEVTVEAEPHYNATLVHHEDVGDIIALATEKAALISGSGVWPIFDAQTSVENIVALSEGAARGLGFKGTVKFTAPSEGNVFGKAFNTLVNTNSARAVSVLGWTPKRTNMLTDIDVYAQSWLAGQQ